MPADFELLLPKEGVFLENADVWAPLQETYVGPRNRTLLTAFLRLRGDVTFEHAQLEMDSIAGRLRELHQVHQLSDTRMRIVPLHRDVVKAVRPALTALFAAAILVLLIACGNVSALLVSRAEARRRETEIRTALGASRTQLLRGLVIESGLLAAMGGVGGVLLAWWGAVVLRTVGPSDLPRLASVGIDTPALAFALATCLATILPLGVATAAHTARLMPGSSACSTLAGGGRSVGTGRQLLRSSVVVGQVALSLVLLAGVGLLVRSFVLLRDVDPGFDARDRLTFRLSLPANRYERSQRVALLEQLEEQIRALPGVRSVGAVDFLPLGGGTAQMPYAYDDDTALSWESVTADGRNVTPDLFRTLDVRLVAGRPFDARDRADGTLVAIVDDVLAAKAWPDQDPVGQRLQLPVFGPAGVTREWHEVIGVVEHVRLHDLSRDVREQVYLPQAQTFRRSMDVVVAGRGDLAGDLAALAEQIPGIVHAQDPELPVHALRAMDQVVLAALEQRRFTVTLAAVFAVVALLLAAVGLYGVVSFWVGSRTRELGIRLTLGSSQGRVLRLVLLEGLRLTALGVLLGLVVALLAGDALSGLLYGVNAFDPPTFAVVVLLLAAAALAACYIPARRATRVDPIIALRQE
jgi:putative ABC transport system permease protein